MQRGPCVPPLFTHLPCSPLFVTWNARSSRPGRPPRLRGCIGNFDPLPLHQGIAEYALTSAFKDSRFTKIEEHELPSLECGLVFSSFLFSFLNMASGLVIHALFFSVPSPQRLLVDQFRGCFVLS